MHRKLYFYILKEGGELMPSVDQVWDSLKHVYDPCCSDRGISVVDMGVADKVEIDSDGTIKVELLLTTGWCPFVSSMEGEIPKQLQKDFGDVEVEVKSKWEPGWTPERLSESAREKLSMPLDTLLPIREERIRREQEKLTIRGANG